MINRPWLLGASLLLAGCGSAPHAPSSSAGVVMVSTTTVGTRHPDGYLVTVDGSARPIGIPDSVAISVTVTVAPHVAELSGLAPGCTVVNGARREFDLAANATSPAI